MLQSLSRYGRRAEIVPFRPRSLTICSFLSVFVRKHANRLAFSLWRLHRALKTSELQQSTQLTARLKSISVSLIVSIDINYTFEEAGYHSIEPFSCIVFAGLATRVEILHKTGLNLRPKSDVNFKNQACYFCLRWQGLLHLFSNLKLHRKGYASNQNIVEIWLLK